VAYKPILGMFDNDPIWALVVGGISMVIAGGFCLFISDVDEVKETSTTSLT
jgi:hypothetical protein